MLQIITDLQGAVATLRTQANSAVTLAATLKGQRDATVTENGQLTQQVAALQTALATAQGAGLTAEEQAAIVDSTDLVQQASQALSDSNTVNAPSN